MSNYFIGVKGNGVRGLNSLIKKQKFKGKKLQDTIDRLYEVLKECDIIEFDDSNSVYVGTFFYSPVEKSELMLKQSKEYKYKLKLIKPEFEAVGIDDSNMIIELSTKLK